MDYQYEPAYEYNDSVAFDSDSNTFSGSYTMTEILDGQAMNDMARYLGALYRQEGSTVESITYYYPERADYTWDEAGTLKGSNWKAAYGTSLVSAIVADYNDGQSISNSLTLSNGEDTLNINFELTIEPNKEIVSVATLADINVAYGTVIGDVGLPATVEVTLDDLSTQTLAVKWDGGTPAYGGNTAGTYAFEGTITLAAGIANTGGYTATVEVVVEANSAKAITAFNFAGLTPEVVGVVDEGARTVALTVPFGTDVTTLVPTITHTGANISPNTGIAQNFTAPVTYTVTSADASSQAYVVTVTVAPAPIVTTSTVERDPASTGGLDSTFATNTFAGTIAYYPAAGDFPTNSRQLCRSKDHSSGWCNCRQNKCKLQIY